MSIELRCPGCQNLLRVPDTAAGKQARCPQCQNVVSVPAAQAVAEASTGAAETPSTTPHVPAFTPSTAPPPSAPYKAPDVSNPYAASGFYEPAPGIESGGPLTHRQVSFDDVLQTTWKIFQQNIGPLAIVGVILFAVQMVKGVIGFGINLATTLIDPTLNAVASLMLNVADLFILPIVTLGATIPCIILLRSGKTMPGDVMKFTKYYFTELLKVLVFVLMLIPLFAALGGGIAASVLMKQEILVVVVIILFVILYLVAITLLFANFMISTAFVVDRGAGPIESLKLSWQFMSGNRGMATLVVIVVGLVGGLFSCCTLGFGSVLLTPFLALLATVMYFLVTGQKESISPGALGPQFPEGPKVGLPG